MRNCCGGGCAFCLSGLGGAAMTLYQFLGAMVIVFLIAAVAGVLMSEK